MILTKNSIQKLIDSKKIVITPQGELKESSIKLHFSKEMIIKPKEFLVSKTLEYIRLSDNIVGLYDSYAKLAQSGIMTHLGSMFCDSDTDGQLTLELFNASDNEIQIKKGDRCGQLILIETK